MKYIKLIIAVLITGIAIYIYSGFFGIFKGKTCI